jgi:hypothetical protein
VPQRLFESAGSCPRATCLECYRGLGSVCRRIAQPTSSPARRPTDERTQPVLGVRRLATPRAQLAPVCLHTP